MQRSDAVAIVAGLSAVGGAVAGAATGLIAAAVLTPTEPVTAGQIALMATESALVFGLAGAGLGTLVGFGALRRVSLGRLVAGTNLGMAAGILAGWLAGPWAWHHFAALSVAGYLGGAAVARLSSGTAARSQMAVGPAE